MNIQFDPLTSTHLITGPEKVVVYGLTKNQVIDLALNTLLNGKATSIVDLPQLRTFKDGFEGCLEVSLATLMGVSPDLDAFLSGSFFIQNRGSGKVAFEIKYSTTVHGEFTANSIVEVPGNEIREQLQRNHTAWIGNDFHRYVGEYCAKLFQVSLTDAVTKVLHNTGIRIMPSLEKPVGPTVPYVSTPWDVLD